MTTTAGISAEAVAGQMRKYAKEADRPAPPECIVTPQSYEFEEWADALTSLAAELAQCREALSDMVRLVDELADNALQQGLSGTITWDRVAGAADMFNRQDAARTALKGASHEPTI